MSPPHPLQHIRWCSWRRRGWPSTRGPALEYTIPSTSGKLWIETELSHFWVFRINNETVYRQRGGSNWLYKVLFLSTSSRILLPCMIWHDRMNIGISTQTWAQEQDNCEPGDETIFHTIVFTLHRIQCLQYRKLGARGEGWQYGKNNSWVRIEWEGGLWLWLMMSSTLLRCKTTQLLPLCLWTTSRPNVSDAGPCTQSESCFNWLREETGTVQFPTVWMCF